MNETGAIAAKMSKYIYGFIELTRHGKFDPVKIGSREITAIAFKDVAAVVSEPPEVELNRLDAVQLTELIGRHQQVIEQIFQAHPIIPVQFGNIAADELAVRRILEQTYIQFKMLFHHIRGKIELVVQASANKPAWVNQIAQSNPNILELAGHLPELSEAEKERTRIEIGKILFDAVSQKEKQVIEDIFNTLKNGETHSACGRLLNAEMIFNTSFLVEKNRETEFDQKVNFLANKYANEVNFKYIGPMPPTSFANLRLELPDLALIDQSRKVLGLADNATLAEIKSAYRQLATVHHPDKNGNCDSDGQKFREIAEAYHILETFCQHYRYSFSKDAIENTVLVHLPESR